MTISSDSATIVVCALYHFAPFSDHADWQAPLLQLMSEHGLRGTLLLADEGINGTIAGHRAGIDALLMLLRGDERFVSLKSKLSFDKQMPFHRAKVKLKREIVTMGVEDIDPLNIVGTYVKPQDWNALISDPDVTVIDTRNEYEIHIGSFQNAINPHTTSFREFPAYAEAHLDTQTHKKVAMFCTGGIRCEKSTAYLKSQGFDEVYHLEGGILNYLETIPAEQSLWEGECFVFDNRVTVNHQLQKGHYDQCHACRMPIDDLDKLSDAYIEGISCPHCIDQYSAAQRQRFTERQHQMRLARGRGEAHIGEDAVIAQAQHKAAKTKLRDTQRAPTSPSPQQKKVDVQALKKPDHSG
ncbi:MAG: UPF0176 protein [Candidatus Azotimanducaceae bacterium]|jgi:UPF0176 protein